MQDASALLLELVDITRRFPGVVALDGVSLALAAGEVHALVGENGAGKSTLINIVSGLLAPDAGHILLAGRRVTWANPVEARRAGIVAVHQEAELFATLSVAENMALEQGLPAGPAGWVHWNQIFDGARQAVSLLGEPIDVRQAAAGLSVAQRHMTQIAAAVMQCARVLVLDEPTSALTASETGWLFAQIKRLKSAGVGILYISHRQEEIFQLADRVTVLRDGKLAWSGASEAIDRAGLIRHMVGRHRAAELGASFSHARIAPGTPRLDVRGFTASDGRFADIWLTVAAGEILGIYGLVGSGRSEFARAVFGLDKTSNGTLAVDGRITTISSPAHAVAAGLAYLPEDRLRQGIFRGLSIRANTVLSTLANLSGRGLTSTRRERSATGQQIAALGIKCRDPEQPIGQLSGGNQQKVVLGRWLLPNPAVLILDEPTRGVDVGAKAEIHRILRQLAADGTAIVLISSDLPEVMENSHRVAVFRAGRIAGQFDPAGSTPDTIAAAALPEESTSQREVPPRAAHGERRRAVPNEIALATAIAVLFAVLAFSTDSFFTADNLRGLLSHASVGTILALGAAAIILAGGIDISLGSLLALAAGVGGLVLKLPYSPAVTLPAGILAALAVGTAGGLTNAGLTLLGRVHPIVVTLGTMTIYRGLLISLTGGDTITDLPSAYVRWSSTQVLGINGSVVLSAVTAVAVYVLLNHLRCGRHLLALGSSPRAARLVGISQSRIWLLAFGIGGILAGLAGLLELSQTGAMQSGMGNGYELQAIAAAVIGGVSISGGRGSVLGVCLGALLLSLIYNAVVLWEISRYHASLITGGLLLVAVLVDLAWRRFEEAR
ncbi:MAG: ATP-binding cassette domain-containing protein [Planctomycetia bacterium]|nr:ATP-binding cassette domain-containing protein [Planctomycetia bacterium]